MKRIIAWTLALGLLCPLAGCGRKNEDSGAAAPDAGGTGVNDPVQGAVYYLNFKPEQDEQWQALAETYTAETGVPVTVLTAASGQYETTLKSEIAKTEAPTLFQVNGPVGLSAWKSYCYDLRDTPIYEELISDDFALYDEERVAGVAYVIESYGILCNRALLEQAGYQTADITDFASLKRVAEDITARKDELGFSAFTSAGMDATSAWRFYTHLANVPLYYEYRDAGVDSAETVEGTYLDNYRAIWDLYINNATCSPAVLSTKTASDAIAEFAAGQAVFYQNGTWAYSDVAELGDENLAILPLYIGVEGEEKQGLCTGTENYWCVNQNAAGEDVQATLDFLYWCVTSDEGTRALCEEMGFSIPFKGNREAANPLVRAADEYVANGYEPVTWAFSTMPSEQWKSDLGSALTAYAADQTDAKWDAVRTAFVDGWAAEYQHANP